MPLPARWALNRCQGQRASGRTSKDLKELSPCPRAASPPHVPDKLR